MLATEWTAEKTASVDWTDAKEVLQNGFTFLEMIDAHPALAAYYGLSHRSATETSPALSPERMAERQYVKQLFLQRTPFEELERDSYCQPTPADTQSVAQTSRERTVVDDLLQQGPQAVLRAKQQFLKQWGSLQLFTLRHSRWCRHCGAEGHTLGHCPVRLPLLTQQRALSAAGGVSGPTNPYMELCATEDADDSAIKVEPLDHEDEPPAASADSLKRRREDGEEVTSRLSVLQKFYQHQRHLEQSRLLQEKKNGGAASQRPKDRVLPPGGRGKAELELFSDERRRGLVERLDTSFNVGFVRPIGAGGAGTSASDLKFFIDRSDCGVKSLQVGDRVTFKLDNTKDYPLAMDVRVEYPVITPADVKEFMNQCRLAGRSTTTMDILSMLVSHTSEWQDVLRHIHQSMCASTNSTPLPSPEGGASSTTWVSHVQTIIELTTFHANREPIHTSILTAFLKMLVSPITAKGLTTATAGGTPGSSVPASPPVATPATAGSFRFFPDLFSHAMRYWLEVFLPAATAALQKNTTATSSTAASSSGGSTAGESDYGIATLADGLCEAVDLVVLLRQHTAEYRAGASVQPVYHLLSSLVREAMRLAGDVAQHQLNDSAASAPPAVRRLRAALIRLEKVRPTSGSRNASIVPVIPSESELAIPPPYPESVFHPSQLPIQRIAHQEPPVPSTHSHQTSVSNGGGAVSEPTGVPSPYESSETFIRAHCQLLRADTFETTSRILAASCFSLAQYPADPDTMADAEHSALYDSVKFMGRVMPRDRDYANPVGYLFQVKPRSAQASLVGKLHQGTCVCFVTSLEPDHIGASTPSSAVTVKQEEKEGAEQASTDTAVPELFWGVISTCDETLLQAGIIVVAPCAASSVDHSAPSFSQLLTNLSRNTQQGRLDRCLMLETSIFYAGYAGIMNSLTTFLGPLAMPLPLGRRIIGPTDAEDAADWKAKQQPQPQGRSSTVSRANALSTVKHRPLLGYIPPHCEQAFKEIISTIRTSFQLDAGQEEVMRLLPHQDILLVQGPPGTGKSFIGCRVVEAYVRYKQKISSGDILQNISIAALRGVGAGGAAHAAELLPPLSPMVVITYKNHALDEFLVDLLNCQLWGTGTSGVSNPTDASSSTGFPSGQRLVRIGGRSKDSRLDPFNLSSLMREKADKSTISRYREHIGVLHQRLDRLLKEIHHLENGRVPKAYFERWLTPEQSSFISFENRDEWLLGGRYVSKVAESNISLPDRNFFKTLIHTSISAALEAAEQQESTEAVRKRLQTIKQECADEEQPPVKKPRAEDVGGRERRTTTTEDGVENDEEEVARSIFQEMKREDESREYNNTLHTTVLSPESIYLAHHPPVLPPGVPTSLQSLWSLEPVTRHHYYAYLIQKTISEKAMNCFHIMSRITNFLTIRNHALESAKLSLLRAADVVGLTTTGCAMNQNLIRSLRPRVLVVEEAAEVLESQLLACITDSLQQIILIGDHFQLQPKVETFSYEKVNHLNLSLFERLSGHIPVTRLTEQRRMHPELSALVRPFYKEHRLLDHPLLRTRPFITSSGSRCIHEVPGLAKRLFFWRHSYPEENAPGSSRSKINRQELEMVRQAVLHMVQEGVLQHSITVITPYLGQCRMLRSHLRLSHLPDVQVSTVDLFQGDENDVIVLSLVRTARLTEFLRTRNRLVVSCSRARFAMIMIGNDSILHQCSHWEELLTEMETKRCVGSRLPVTITTSRDAATIQKKVMYLRAKKPS